MNERFTYGVKAAIAISVLACSGFGSAQALTYNPDGTVYGYELDGITPAGQPNFQNDANVVWKSSLTIRKNIIRTGSATLKASYDMGDFFFNVPGDASGSYVVNDASYSLNASFSYDIANNTWNLSGNKNSVKISGTVVTDKGTATKNLFLASLDSWNFGWDLETESNFLIGFNTTVDKKGGTICDLYGCTLGESAYLSLLYTSFNPTDLSNFDNKGKYNFTSDAVAVTTIPVPAAVWLFGSGLIGIAGLARRKKLA